MEVKMNLVKVIEKRGTLFYYFNFQIIQYTCDSLMTHLDVSESASI